MLLFFFRFLATGEAFRSLAFQFRTHHSNVSRIVKQTLQAIVSSLLQEAIPEPTVDSLKQTISEFNSKWQFPNCCGAIDGKHVRVRCPSNAGSAFFNYKEYHSIVLLAIVDANIKFMAVDVGSYGREGDAGSIMMIINNCMQLPCNLFSGIFLKSSMGQRINNEQFNIPEPSTLPYTDIMLPNVIVGDEAFALNKNLMKPYPRSQAQHDRTKAIFNYRLSRARRTTENAFGVLSSYFRIFFMPIATNPDRTDNIILSCCILHNMLRSQKILSPCEENVGSAIDNEKHVHNLISIVPATGRPSTEGSIIRDKFKDYFNASGAVSWQDNML